MKWSFDWKFALLLGVVWFGVALLVRPLCASYYLWMHSLAGIGTWLIAFGLFVAFWQYKQMRRSTNAQVAVGLYLELRSEDTMMRTLRYIYSHSPGKLASARGKTKDDIDSLVDRLDLLAALAIHGVVDKKLAIEAYGGPSYLKCWLQLYQFIQDARIMRGRRFCENTEEFALRTYCHYERLYKNREDHWPRYYRREGDTAVSLRDQFRPDKKDKELVPIWFVERKFQGLQASE